MSEKTSEKTEKEKIQETAHRDGVKLYTNSHGEHFATFDHRQQMFGICTAIRSQLWNALDNKELPVKITWRIEKEYGKECEKVAPKNDVKAQVPEKDKKRPPQEKKEVKHYGGRPNPRLKEI